MDHQKIVRGEVTTAVPLPPDKLRALEAGAGAGDRPQGAARGAASTRRSSAASVTRLGSTVYDGSVTTQLQKMKAVVD